MGVPLCGLSMEIESRGGLELLPRHSIRRKTSPWNPHCSDHCSSLKISRESYACSSRVCLKFSSETPLESKVGTNPPSSLPSPLSYGSVHPCGPSGLSKNPQNQEALFCSVRSSLLLFPTIDAAAHGVAPLQHDPHLPNILFQKSWLSVIGQ